MTTSRAQTGNTHTRFQTASASHAKRGWSFQSNQRQDRNQFILTILPTIVFISIAWRVTGSVRTWLSGANGAGVIVQVSHLWLSKKVREPEDRPARAPRPANERWRRAAVCGTKAEGSRGSG